jgi:hypothetical protein
MQYLKSLKPNRCTARNDERRHIKIARAVIGIATADVD